jgi:predicted nucleic acid-binding protein
VYLDTSYIAKFYFNEPESERVREIVRIAPIVHSSPWALAEFHGVVHRRTREGLLSADVAQELFARFHQHVREGLWKLVSRSRSAAAENRRPHDFRSADSLYTHRRRGAPGNRIRGGRARSLDQRSAHAGVRFLLRTDWPVRFSRPDLLK